MCGDGIATNHHKKKASSSILKPIQVLGGGEKDESVDGKVSETQHKVFVFSINIFGTKSCAKQRGGRGGEAKGEARALFCCN